MIWLAGGVLYSMAYLAAGAYLRGSAHALLWLRISALLVPPLTGVLVIACVAVTGQGASGCSGQRSRSVCR